MWSRRRACPPPGLLAVLKRKLAGPVAATTFATPVAAIDAPVAAVPKPIPTAKLSPKPAASATVPVAKPPAPAVAVSVRPKPEPTTAAPAAKGFFVQVGAYSTKQRAQAAASATGGSVTAVGKLFRVRSGPHKDRGQADTALAKVRAAGYADAKVVSAP